MNERKRKVADIALNLFIEKGFQQTSIQEIIDKADISKGTFYNYFSSKNDCIAEILENIRYDASQQRVAMQIGKDPQDREVLIEQITIIMKLNEEKNLRTLFENILSSDQADLKKLVLQHRVIEMEWLANRLVDVIGEDIRGYATEATVLYFGMLQYMLFTLNLTNSQFTLHELIETILSYVEVLIPEMQKKNSSFLNNYAIDLLHRNVHKKVVTKSEVMEMAEQLQGQHDFNEEQQDLFDVIVSELESERVRKIVVKKLLKPFLQLFEGTTMVSQVQLFTNAVWNYLKTI
ncbi:TetR/AcrR family transcriptional regulator [Gracilibacillus thailandensis]|jgi:AcrR family transcriptional regulator|uniref:TetR family transcriptional regulator n=1 Tax=Gracilibacillus thailandensis TaxID=563735 RepID=A0A6N7QZF7_9BACI|nr:TetR/AcrR family transcriptional regulator [Gracilibacillus thailandensis]MRI67458.1 TetR family transcriptional regulator [Gracilibacillus thailandensis]